MGEVFRLPKGAGIGPAPERCRPAQIRAWDDLVSLVEPGFLIWRDCVWLELTAHIVAIMREQESHTLEEISATCYWLAGLTLGPNSLPKLGFEFEWLLLPEEDL